MRALKAYGDLVSLREIEASRIVRLLFAFLIGYQILLFSTLVANDAGTLNALAQNAHTCWPYFQSCDRLFFLTSNPYGFTQGLFYACVFLMQLSALISVARGKLVYAHFIFVLTLIWEAVLVLLISYEAGEAYIYYHLLLSLIILFFPNKLWHTRALIVGAYVLGALIEYHRTFILGDMPWNMPFVADVLRPWVVNTAVALQGLGVWYLLSSSARYRRGVILALCAFHVYAGAIFDQYFFLLIAPLLYIVFWDDESPSRPQGRALALVAVFFILIVTVHAWIVVASDTRSFTFARPHLGIATFFPSTSGVSVATIERESGSEVVRKEWQSRPCRCSPYTRWFELKSLCRHDPTIRGIKWTLDLELGQRAMHRVIDVLDVCAVEFSSVAPNTWIVKP